MQTSRRKLLLTGAAAGAGLTTSAFAKAAPPKFDEVYDVVVVGSGIAGTMAAPASYSHLTLPTKA